MPASHSSYQPISNKRRKFGVEFSALAFSTPEFSFSVLAFSVAPSFILLYVRKRRSIHEPRYFERGTDCTLIGYRLVRGTAQSTVNLHLNLHRHVLEPDYTVT